MFRVAILSSALIAAVFAGHAAQSTSNEPRSKDFIILNDDGYGTSDCLVKASACGKIVADAWCESKGFAKSVDYRPARADDVTHTVSTRRSQINETFVISCSE